jgi:6,7-dimethyl-8-ribityllumazine synthase
MRYDEAGKLDYPTMSSESREWNADASGLKFAIAVSRFNHDITEKLLAGAREALTRAGAAAAEVFYVPGAFELPLAAKRLAAAYDAVIALAAVIRVETPHFEHVAREAARGLQQVAIETGKPVAFGVLTTDTWEQAAARAGGGRGNKGYDAAMSAVEMARLFSKPPFAQSR